MHNLSGTFNTSNKAKIGCFLLCLLFILNSDIKAQEVEHNYTVGPQFTDCDSLFLQELSTTQVLSKIRSTKFRYQKNFRLTRKTGFQGGEFYSCDNQSGFMIIKNNNTESLYFDVDKSIWEELISGKDPEGYFENIKKELRLFIEPE